MPYFYVTQPCVPFVELQPEWLKGERGGKVKNVTKIYTFYLHMAYCSPRFSFSWMGNIPNLSNRAD